MGGLVVDIGEKHIDLSIATKLRDMERILREPLPPLA
jgi:F0F1-type ATP synthase delta subunit